MPLLLAASGVQAWAGGRQQPLHQAAQPRPKAAAPAAAAAVSPAPATLQATVLSIGDGDTLRVRDGDRRLTVRLACVDAPEISQSPYGVEARNDLRRRLPIGTPVQLAVKTTDRYGRIVAEVISDLNIGLAMVEDGEAFAYRQYLGSCKAKDYLEAEQRAASHHAGVWKVPGGITRPWQYRRDHRTAQLPDGTTPSGRRYRCSDIGSYARAQELLRQGHTYLDSNGDGQACESLPH